MIQFPKPAVTAKGKSRAILFASASSALAAVVTVAIAGCSQSQAKPAPTSPGPMSVDVVKVRQGNVPLTGNWVGTLDGFVNAQIQPQVSGYLVHQNYREGLRRKGPGTLPDRSAPFPGGGRPGGSASEAGQGQLAQAEAQQGLTQINLKRDTPLAQARAIAQSQLDNDKQQAAQADASVAAADAGVSAAEAALTTARLNLGFTQVRSLVSGVAGQAATQVGNLVSPQSVLTSVSLHSGSAREESARGHFTHSVPYTASGSIERRLSDFISAPPALP